MQLAPKELTKQMEILIGRPVTAKDGKVTDLTKGVFGVFATDAGEPVILVVSDVAFAAYAGAALALVPKQVAEESIRAQALADSLAENFHEVINVLGGLFNTAGVVHVILREVCVGRDQLPADAAPLVTDPGKRQDFELTVNDYGSGQFSVMQR
jgi:hypothetical protein